MAPASKLFTEDISEIPLLSESQDQCKTDELAHEFKVKSKPPPPSGMCL